MLSKNINSKKGRWHVVYIERDQVSMIISHIEKRILVFGHWLHFRQDWFLVSWNEDNRLPFLLGSLNILRVLPSQTLRVARVGFFIQASTGNLLPSYNTFLFFVFLYVDLKNVNKSQEGRQNFNIIDCCQKKTLQGRVWPVATDKDVAASIQYE